MISDRNMVHAINNSTTSRMTEAGEREAALIAFYSAERRAGACPLVANERMLEFSKRLDREAASKRAADDAFNRDLDIIRSCMERR